MTNQELDDQYKNSKSSYEVFYDDEDETKVTQLRFQLKEDESEIKNKRLVYLLSKKLYNKGRYKNDRVKYPKNL